MNSQMQPAPPRRLDKLKAVLAAGSVQEQFERALGNAAPLFAASVLDLCSSSQQLQECDPGEIVREALKAAVLRLPLSRGLGFAWVVPRRDHGQWRPQMQIGWKGWVQLAQRSGQYRSINAGPIYAGERVVQDRLSGDLSIEGEPTSDEEIGYFAHFRLINGFEKAEAWSLEKIRAHVNKYVPGINRKGSAWQTHFGPMATKTVLSYLLRRYGPLSIEMQQAVASEAPDASDLLDLGPASGPEVVTMQPAQPQPELDEPKRPAWQDLLTERVNVYREIHSGKYPEGYPEEITDEAMAKEWIAWFDEHAEMGF